jgi:hypothetical protein
MHLHNLYLLVLFHFPISLSFIHWELYNGFISWGWKGKEHSFTFTFTISSPWTFWLLQKRNTVGVNLLDSSRCSSALLWSFFISLSLDYEDLLITTQLVHYYYLLSVFVQNANNPPPPLNGPHEGQIKGLRLSQWLAFIFDSSLNSKVIPVWIYSFIRLPLHPSTCLFIFVKNSTEKMHDLINDVS